MKNEGVGSGVPRGSGFSVVVAMDRKRGIGKDGGLPWPKLKGDMKFFRELTTCPDSAAVEKRWGLKAEESGEERSWDEVSAMLKFAHKLPEASDEKRNAVIMGRVTWESLPEKFRPLPDRLNILWSKSGFDPHVNDVLVRKDIDETFAELVSRKDLGSLYVVGGAGIYAAVLRLKPCRHIYLTEIDAEFPCDAFFHPYSGFQPVLSSPWIVEDGIRYRFRRYDRVV